MRGTPAQKGCSRFSCIGKREHIHQSVQPESTKEQKRDCLEKDTRVLRNPVSSKFCTKIRYVREKLGQFYIGKTEKNFQHNSGEPSHLKATVTPSRDQFIKRVCQTKRCDWYRCKKFLKDDFRRSLSKHKFADKFRCTLFKCLISIERSFTTFTGQPIKIEVHDSQLQRRRFPNYAKGIEQAIKRNQKG